jgi:hypothetical protein
MHAAACVLRRGSKRAAAAWNPAGLLWASKRWARAQRLRIEYPEAAAAEVAGLLMGRAPDLDGLAELVLDCPRAGSLPQREAACMWLGGLLARAGALRVLSIALDDVPALPPLRQLAHLKLTVYDGAAAHVAASLPALVSLVTFAMAFQGAANAEEDGAPLQIPPLRLASLAKLRYVGLSGVAPAAITLPPACKLEVKDCGDAGMEAWQSVRAQLARHAQHRQSCLACRKNKWAAHYTKKGMFGKGKSETGHL